MVKQTKPGEFLKTDSGKKGIFKDWSAVDWFWAITGFVVFTAVGTILREMFNISRVWTWAIVSIGIAIAYQFPKLIRKNKRD